MVTEGAKQPFYETINPDKSHNVFFTNFYFRAACFEKNLF